MPNLRSVVLALFAFSGLPSFALEWSDLSPAAQRIVSKDDIVILNLAAGQRQEGVVVAETPDAITLRQKRGAVEFEMPYQRAGIVSVEKQGVCTAFLAALKPLAYEPKRNYTEAQVRLAVQLFDEYLEKCGGGDFEEGMRAHRNAYGRDLDNMVRGMEKVDGDWLPAVAAAVRKFDIIEARLADLARQHPGVDRDGFRGDLRAQQHYKQFVEQRRAIARELPELVTRRVPQLIERRHFTDAASELTSFIQFWVNRVIRAEAHGGRGRADQTQAVFQSMDFGLLIRLQQQVMAAYEQHVAKDARAGEANAEGMVYVPGGFFLFGDPDADIRADNFPLRIIHLDPYWLDQHEVSNKDYREFVEYVERTGDYSNAHPDAPPLKKHRPKGWDFPGLSGDQQPVVGVDWFDAYAYAKWKGKRLPTEAEWERAARGPANSLYPWGNEPVAGQIVNWVEGRRRLEAEINRLIPPPEPPPKGRFGRQEPAPPAPPPVVLPDTTWAVDALRPPEAHHEFFAEMKHAVSPWNLYHMAGNAAEWVFDQYDPAGYTQLPMNNPVGASASRDRIFRGGSFQSLDGAELSAPFRNALSRRVAGRGATEPLVGFRCAKSAE